MDFLKELYRSEITSSKYSETDLAERMNRFLRLMLISKYCHFAEILGATAIAFLNAKMKSSFVRYSKDEEEKKVLDILSSYTVGDVVNFYISISKRRISYIADFMGYPPLFMQEIEKQKILITSCNTIKEVLDLIRSYYIKYKDIYNAYKHGYRVIPTTLDSSHEAMLFVNDNGEAIVLELNLKGPPREDKLKSIREEQKDVLQKICNIEKYSGKYILLDLDNDKIC